VPSSDRTPAERLGDAERAIRERRKVERVDEHLSRSGIPALFDERRGAPPFQPVSPEAMFDIGEAIKAGRIVVLHGPGGHGKTRTLCEFVRRFCIHFDRQAEYLTLGQYISAPFPERAAIRTRLRTCGLVAIDELDKAGKSDKADAWVRQEVFDILNDHYAACRPLMLACNSLKVFRSIGEDDPGDLMGQRLAERGTIIGVDKWPFWR
jgi:hypothetical protein